MRRDQGCSKFIDAALGLTLVAVASTVAAQESVPVPPAAAAAAAPETLETVKVTAQGRVQELQDVPVSVKTFSAKQIEAANITSTQDFINLTPNVAFDHSFTFANSFVTIRGVSQLNNADSPVAVVIDGVPQNNQKQLKMNLFDVLRIEVLKGPQGALFGRNAIGGAITIETRQPTNQLEGFGNVEVGNAHTAMVSAGVSGPIVDDKLLYRVAGDSVRSSGLIENTYLHRMVDRIDHDSGLRGKLLFDVDDRLRLDLRASVNDYIGGAVTDSKVSSNRANDIESPRENMLGQTVGYTYDGSFKANYRTDLGTLSAISAYTDLTERYRGDLDFSNPVDSPGGFLGFGFQAGQGQNLRVRMLSQEIRFTSNDDAPFRWIAGGLMLYTQRDLETRAFFDTNGERNQYDDATKRLIERNEHNNNRAYSLFGQVEEDFGAATTVAVGLRYDRDARQQHDIVADDDRNRSFNSVQPKITVTERLMKGLLGYATFSTGFRSGGFNAPGLPDFRAETLRNYEAGIKSTLLDNRLLLNGSAYFAQSKNFQYFFVDGATAAQLINNIERVHIKGVDIDFQYLPVAGLQFDGGVGTTDSRIRQNDATPSTVGNYTPKASPYKVNLGVQYSRALFGVVGMARFDSELRSKRYWQIDNADVERSFALYNARISVSSAKDVWSAYAYVKNLANTKYYADFNPNKYSGLGYAIGALADERQFGVGTRIRF